MDSLMKNWKIIILVAALVISFVSITINGLELGVDFKGGTLFQLHLEEKPESPEQMTTITSIIEQRVDSFGLKDTKVTSFGDEFITVQIAETDQKNIDELEVLLRTQGKFEATLNGEVLFSGSEIRRIIKDPAQGYGYNTPGSGGGAAYGWSLPFVLEPEAAGRFSRGVFHKCELSSFNPSTGNSYDCEKTYFFIDRPTDAVIVLPSSIFERDRQSLLLGASENDIPPETDINELMVNSSVPYFFSDNGISEADAQTLKGLVLQKKNAIVHPSVSKDVRDKLSAMGYILKEIDEPENPDRLPWVWLATGARQIISITSGIANLEPYIDDIGSAKIFSDLFITGGADTPESAKQRLTSLTILLETGSLPVSVDSISKETITPYLGKEFLQTTFLMGVVALVVVSLVIFLRYKKFTLGIPIMITALSEVFMTLGFYSIIGGSLDLATMAGIIAVVGTGVNDQIIITDELMKGTEASAESYKGKVKRAFFIIFAAAMTVIATMAPLLILGTGLGKLKGFALATIVGVLTGILITRPAYAEFAKKLMENDKK